MRAREFSRVITEKASIIPGDPNSDPLFSLKSAIAHKIKDLPNTPEVKDQLKEIEDALAHLDSGKKRRGSAEDELDTWKDEDVRAAKSMLARYLVSMNAPYQDKIDMLKLWKQTGLINVEFITSPNGMVGIDKVVKRYGNNLAIQEMSNDLLTVDSMGVGKGEFMLRVMSPIIRKPKKGDLEIVGMGTLEVKTNNENAARMADRNVKPTTEYHNKSLAFTKKYGRYWIPDQTKPEVSLDPITPQKANSAANNTQSTNNQQDTQTPITPQGSVAEGRPKGPAKAPPPKKIKPFSKTGINLGQMLGLYQKVPVELKNDFLNDLKSLVEEIFPEKKDLVPNIISAVANNKIGPALQYWSRAAVLNYMAHKDNIGILFIDLKASPTSFTFFNSVEELTKAGLRLHAKTPYVISGDYQNLYPPVAIQTTTQIQ
jgi:hypothetical protein